VNTLRKLVEFHEGKIPYAYRDSLGLWTVGIGRLIDARKGAKLPAFIVEQLSPATRREFEALAELPMTVTKWPAARLTDEQVYALFAQDLDEHCRECDEKLPWVKALDPVRQAVIYDMYFNLRARLLEFKNTLAFVKMGNWAEAASNMLRSKWATQVGSRATRLAAMMESGKWPS
jgi:GH24 family phage-related lysozyme (muramidase)